MNQIRTHHEDPTFDIAMSDTAGSDLSVEAMEAAHEAVEEQRAANIGDGVLKVVQHNNIAPLQSLPAIELRLLIESIQYKSQLKATAGALTMALARGQISNDDYNVLEDEFAAKKISFEPGKASAKQWSPSDVLGTMPSHRIRSAGERAANDRHDLDD